MSKRISIHCTSKDRHSEVALLLQSLRTQTHQAWDLVLMDDASGNAITNCHFVVALINRLKLEGHRVKLYRNNISRGVCYARNKCIEIDRYDNPFVCRLDDDCIPDVDYLERLVAVLDNGFDVASGVIPLLSNPEVKRETKFVSPIINYHEFNEQGDIIVNRDDCGFAYTDEKVLGTHQFRTNALFKREVIEKIVAEFGTVYPDFLTKVGFREELFASFKAQALGFKIGVDTGAVAFHLQTPSGGCRSQTYAQDVQQDDQVAKSWSKKLYEKYGDFLK